MSVDPASLGPKAQRVLKFEQRLREITASITSAEADPATWAPLGDYLNLDTFRRTGVWLETMTFERYARFLTAWASGVDFDTVLLRVGETDDTVYLEVEEHHNRPEGEEVVRSLSIYHFDAAGKIDTLDVYLQSPATAGGTPEGLK